MHVLFTKRHFACIPYPGMTSFSSTGHEMSLNELENDVNHTILHLLTHQIRTTMGDFAITYMLDTSMVFSPPVQFLRFMESLPKCIEDFLVGLGWPNTLVNPSTPFIYTSSSFGIPNNKCLDFHVSAFRIDALHLSRKSMVCGWSLATSIKRPFTLNVGVLGHVK